MKSKGELFYAAMMGVLRERISPTIEDFDGAAVAYERSAIEQASQVLSHVNVETFLADVERRLAEHGPAVTFSIGADMVPRLIAIVRHYDAECHRAREIILRRLPGLDVSGEAVSVPVQLALHCTTHYYEVEQARAEVERLRPEAEAWRKGQAVLKELCERVIPCGHRIEDLIGGDGSVTKCGACLAARKVNNGGR